MSSMARRDEDFGKDHGLIHEVVVTGRKAGAGQAFWAKLAHDEDLFKRVVSVVTSGGVTDTPGIREISSDPMDGPKLMKISSDSWVGEITSIVDEPELAKNDLAGVRLWNGLMLAFPKDRTPKVGDKVEVFNLRFRPEHQPKATAEDLTFAVLRRPRVKRAVEAP